MRRLEESQSRRAFVKSAAAAGVAMSNSFPGFSRKTDSRSHICVFSKHLQWLDVGSLARTAAQIGFDGIDLTVRSGGHIEPENAEKELPGALEVISKAGLSVPMITSGIVDVSTPHAERVVRAMKSSGITRYRWGGLKYSEKLPIAAQLEGLKRQASTLAELNAKYGVCAMYHTHSGLEVGASIWDLWEILKDLDQKHVAVNLDLGHITIEGGLGGRVTNTRLIAPLTRGIAVKDFKRVQTSQGEWRPEWCPLGKGMVNFAQLFAILKDAKFDGPIQLHFEYALGGAESGKKTLTIGQDVVIETMRHDLATLRALLAKTDF